MKKTRKQVQENFKEALTVRCLLDGLDYKFDFGSIHYDKESLGWYSYTVDNENDSTSVLIWSNRLQEFAGIVSDKEVLINYEDESDYVKGQLDLIQLMKDEIVIFESEAEDITDLSLDILFLLKKLEPLEKPNDYVFTEGSNMHINDYVAKPKQYEIGIDTFDRAESNMTLEEKMACIRFNIDKYNWRKKDQAKQDLNKIIAYAEWGLKQMK